MEFTFPPFCSYNMSIHIPNKIYESIVFKYRLHENIILLSFVGHDIFKYTTSKMVTDSHDAQREKSE